MEQHLAFEILQEELDHVFFHLAENQFRVFHQTVGNGFYDGFQHQQVLYFGDIRHIDMLFTQVSDLAFCPAVTVYDAFGVQRMEVFQLRKSLCRLDHLLTTAHGLNFVIRENQRIEPVVYAVRIRPFDKQDRFAAP